MNHQWKDQRLLKSDSAITSFPVSFEDWQLAAKKQLSEVAFNSVVNGAGNNEAIVGNKEALLKWRIQTSVLRNTANINKSIQLLHDTLPSPFLLAPIGRQRVFHAQGELASAYAASQNNIPFILSTESSYSIEQVAKVMGNATRWFQLYWGKDSDVSFSMVRRAENAGYTAIVLTVDRPSPSWRTGELKENSTEDIFKTGIINYLTDPVFVQKYGNPNKQMQQTVQQIKHINYNPSLVWENIIRLKQQTSLPIIIKGLLNPNDARKAVSYGADAIVVSNHGGRQLNGAVASIDALPSIIDAVNHNIPVLVDSGIYNGTDMLKALALGATAVLIGRLYIYGLAVAGDEGVSRTIKNLAIQLDLDMANSGVTDISNIPEHTLIKI